VRTNAGRVLGIVNGIVVADFDGEAAIDVGNAMIAAAHLGEEHTKAARVISDQGAHNEARRARIALGEPRHHFRGVAGSGDGFHPAEESPLAELYPIETRSSDTRAI
jgi:hypothetical protein